MTVILEFLTTPSGLVLIPLSLCSIVALALIVEKLITVSRLRAPTRTEHAEIRRLARVGASEQALATLARSRPFYADPLSVLQAYAGQNAELREKAVSLALQTQGRDLTRRLTGLTTIAGLAPLLGLLGTVIGLMVAFRALQDSSGPVEPAIVASGLWQAMITTVVGLAIAVPCLVAQAWFRSRIRHKLADAAALMSEVSLSMSLMDRTET